MHGITPAELCHAQRDHQVNFVDVRTPAEFAVAHAAGAINLPLDELDASKVAHLDPAAPIYVICKSGARAQKAIAKLQAAGYRHLVNVKGGTDAWIAAGLPVNRSGSDAIALPRQVQIAAGSLILAGMAIGLLHPGGLVLAALVGAGLLFSGLTDTCAMAGVLSRMPWNKSGAGSCALPAARS